MIYLISQDHKKYGYGLIQVKENQLIVDNEVFGIYNDEQEALEVLEMIINKHARENGVYDIVIQAPDKAKKKATQKKTEAKVK